MVRVDQNTVDRAYNYALLFLEMTNAFGAFRRFNLIDNLALINCIVRTFRFAYIAIDALIGDEKRHRTTLLFRLPIFHLAPNVRVLAQNY